MDHLLRDHIHMIRPGPRNLITDVDGLLVGNAEDRAARSGVTVVVAEESTIAAVDVRGGAPGTRETDALDPTALGGRVDAVVLSGGSAFGLEAASGTSSWLHERGRGFAVGAARVPIVPAAILFDLLNGGNKDWGAVPPYRGLGYAACAASGAEVALGNAGAGLGARAGAIKGGLGSASFVSEQGAIVGALVAANPFGSVTMPDSPTLWTWALERDGEFGGQPAAAPLAAGAFDYDFGAPVGRTVIGVVATNASLDRAQTQRLALMAQDGIARAVRPAHTPFDGDTIFALATGRHEGAPPDAGGLGHLGMMAADCVARAIGRAVLAAETLGDLPSYRSLHGASLTHG